MHILLFSSDACLHVALRHLGDCRRVSGYVPDLYDQSPVRAAILDFSTIVRMQNNLCILLQLIDLHPQIPVILLTGRTSLPSALSRLTSCGIYRPVREVFEHLLNLLSAAELKPHLQKSTFIRMSERQVTILWLVSHGQSVATIAFRLGINIKTAHRHCYLALAKLKMGLADGYAHPWIFLRVWLLHHYSQLVTSIKMDETSIALEMQHK